MKKDIIKSKYKECDFIVADKYGERRIMQVSYSISDMLYQAEGD